MSTSRLGSKHTIALLCLAGAVIFWGTSFAATKTALGYFSPMTVIWLRMVLATLAFAPFWVRVPRPQYLAGDWKLLALTGLLMPCLYYLFEGYAVTYTTSSQAGVISALVPLVVALGAWFFLKERLGVRPAVAIALSLVGVAVLSAAATSGASAPNPVLGNLLELMAMACAGGSMLAIKYLGVRYNPWLLTAMQAALGAIFFLPGALLSGPSTWLAAPPVAWASVAYLGVVVSLAAFGLYNTALTMLPASRAALAINLVPAVALLTGWLALGESLSPLQLVACAVIVGAVMFGESGSDSEAADVESTPERSTAEMAAIDGARAD